MQRSARLHCTVATPTASHSSSFFCSSYGDHRALHSFPTRRSSDLEAGRCPFKHRGLPSDEDFSGQMMRPNQSLGKPRDRKSTRLNSSHTVISYAVFCLKKKRNKRNKSENGRENS